MCGATPYARRRANALAPPAEVSQLLRVIIKYAKERPELLHEPFAKTAAAALTRVWPCPR